MPEALGVAWAPFDSFATLSMTLLIAASLAHVYGRYLVSALGFLAVGFGGSGVGWSHWSESTGHHNSFGAFFHPTGLAFDDAFLLATHAPFMVVGAVVLALRLGTRA